MTFRIALIAASAAIVGGHSAQARELVSNLSAEGHEVAYIPIDVRLPQWLRRVRYARTVINELLYILSLRKIADADIVHIFSASYWSFLLAPAPAIVIARLLRKRVIVHYHSGEADDHLRRWRTAHLLLRLADEIVVPSVYLERVFASHGLRTRVIPNVVDIYRFAYRERDVRTARLLSARNLEPYYGVDVIIRAFALLKTRFPHATLAIAGSGSAEPSLRSLARGIDGISFLGSVQSMASIYDSADMFVNASTVDNQPLSILEAFATGLPVVSTATGDIPSMLRNGEAGVLADGSDAEEVADAIARLLDEPEVALQFVRRAHSEAMRYTWQRVGQRWNALYSELMTASAVEAVADGA